MSYQIETVTVEYQREPLGLDEAAPRFSWKFASQERDMRQSACQIRVYREDGEMVWNSGRLETGESRGIAYAGAPLEACTAYRVCLETWDENGRREEAETHFETGLMELSNKKENLDRAWDGAQWIAAPEYTVNAKARGVFAIETEFCLMPGSRRAGIVFGAGDFRLLDRTKNEYGLEGENYIRYELNLREEGEIPTLDIYRVGYAKEDRADVPFASVPLVDFYAKEKLLLTEENKWDFHRLRIGVEGNNACAWLDGVLVDAVETEEFYGKKLSGRTLNPRGGVDVLTYPRLNETGFFAGENDCARFKYLAVSNLRAPCAVYICEKPEGGLYGRKSIFQGKAAVEGDCFLVKGEQITADPSHTSVPMFRTVVDTKEKEKPVKARLYTTARGIYECRVNGKPVTERLLAPGNTQYDKRINYQTYDVTKLVQEGKNAVGVTLASGWWSDAQTFTVKNYNYWGDREALLARLVLTYRDGSRQVCVTDPEHWSYYGKGPYLYAGFFLGEEVDGRKLSIYENYSRPDYEPRGWERPVVYEPVPIGEFRAMPPGFGRSWPAVNETSPSLLGGYDAPVYVVDVRHAASCVSVDEGVYIYDLGQEMAGVPRIRLHEKPGTRVVLRYAEMCYPDMEEYANQAGRIMVENYRDATSTDIYICSGEEGEIYQPRFTFHGYRYIEISGVENPPSPGEVESLQYSSVKEFEGSFSSSNELLDRFAENVKWSQKCNFINIPTDCPQRNERMGWAGDTHVFCHTALHNSHLKLFYERNLQAMADLQEENGQFPEIAPVGGGFGGITYECASIFMVNELYAQYGDKRTVEAFYPGMKKYMDYMQDKGLPGRGDMAAVGPLGDWLAPRETDLQLMWNAFYYREADLMAKLAALIGKEEDAGKYHALASRVKEFWNRAFIDPESGKTRTLEGELCDTQCSYVLALEYGVAENIQSAQRNLLRTTRELGHTVGTGFFGTGLLNTALSRAGYVEDACRLMLQTAFPSWLYPVTQGATTIWEHWDSYTEERGFGGYNAMNSFNHYSLGSVLSWMYEWILGIRRQEEYPGYIHFLLEPSVGELEYAQGSVSSPYGTIRSGWRKTEKGLEYTCEIPANTGATLILSDGTRRELGSGSYRFEV